MNEKPLKGTFLLERKDRKAAKTEAEKKKMREALSRDSHTCRRPKCPYKYRKMPVDPCHRQHRGMGGNPKGDRTTRKSVIALCRIDHDLYDHAFLLIDPLDETREFDGPCSFRLYDPKTTKTEMLGSEKHGPHN